MTLWDRDGGEEDDLVILSHTVSSLNGCQATGTWKLRVRDQESDDVGRLMSWSLTVTAIETVELTATTHEDGTYQIFDVPAGEYTVFGSNPGTSTLPLQQKISVDTADISGVDYQIAPKFDITGTVIDAEDHPVTGIAIRATEKRIGTIYHTAVEDESGQYFLLDLPAGIYRVEALVANLSVTSLQMVHLDQDRSGIDFGVLHNQSRTLRAPKFTRVEAVSSNQIHIEWTDTNSGNIPFFILERQRDKGHRVRFASFDSRITSIEDREVDPNARYTYRILASEGFKESPLTDAISVLTLASPTNLKADAVSSSVISLTWEDNSVGEAGFKIEWMTDSGEFQEIRETLPDARTFRVSGLKPDTTYTFRVRAFAPESVSDYSNEVSATTQSAPSPPAAPSQLTATLISQSSVELQWRDNSNNETGFGLERKVGASAYTLFALLPVNAISYRDTTLTPNTTYTYRLRATATVGASAYSNEASVSTASSPPTAPSKLQATLAPDPAIELRWQDNSNNELGFSLERKMGKATYASLKNLGAGITTYSDSDLLPKTTYRYRVLAYNTSGDSAFSNEDAETTPAKLSGNLQVIPSTVNFGKVKVKKTKRATVVLRNRSTTKQLWVTITPPVAPFALSTPISPVQLAPGGSAVIGLSFRPTKKKSYSGKLLLSSTDLGSALGSAALKGAGK